MKIIYSKFVSGYLVGTGKSSLLNRLCNNNFMTMYSSTMSDFKVYNIYLKITILMLNSKFGIPQVKKKKFLSFERHIARKMGGCITVYDITNIKSFNRFQISGQDELHQNCSKLPMIASYRK